MNLRRLFRCGGGAFTPSPATYQGDPTRLSSGAQTERNAILVVHASEKWAGYQGQSFASDVAATSPSDLFTKAFAAASNNPNAWNRLRVQNGDWSGDFLLSDNVTHLGPIFGTSGGLLITPDTGHDPEITGIWTIRGRRVQVSGMKMARCANADVSQADAAIIVEAGGLSANGPPIVKISGNRIGAYWNSTKTSADWNNFSIGIYCILAEQLLIEGNTFHYTNRSIQALNCRIFESVDNDFIEVIQNGHSVHQLTPNWAPGTSYKGIFADDDCYYRIHRNTHRGPLDNAPAVGSAVHLDFVQHMDLTGSQSGHSAQGTGTIPPGALRLLIEDNLLLTDAINAVSGAIPAVNGYICTDYQSPHRTVFWNNAHSSTGFLAQDFDVGVSYVECNSSGPPPRFPSGFPLNSASNTITASNSVTLHSAKNIVRGLLQADGGGAGGGTTGIIIDSGSILMDDTSSADTTTRPGNRWGGTFTQNGDGRWVYTLSGTNTMTQAQFRDAVIAQFASKTAAGAAFV